MEPRFGASAFLLAEEKAANFENEQPRSHRHRNQPPQGLENASGHLNRCLPVKATYSSIWCLSRVLYYLLRL